MKNRNTSHSILEYVRIFVDYRISIRNLLFFLLLLICCTSFLSAPLALLLGLLAAQTIGHPFLHLNHKITQILLQVSVVGLGFGMNIHAAINTGSQGIVFILCSIIGTLFFGIIAGRFLKIDLRTSFLISSGTAICGGSAIAALSPVIQASQKQISSALGCVFILNAIALYLFPFIGHLFHLSQTQFGLWSAIAIHDTSSVIGAASRYGNKALEIATTVKLARALWIIPLSLCSMVFFKNTNGKIKYPWFIALFLLAMILNSYLPIPVGMSHLITGGAKTGLTVALFLIGAGLNKEVVRSIGLRPFIQGLLLWCAISSFALWAVLSFS